jgi:hypothetical protein
LPKSEKKPEKNVMKHLINRLLMACACVGLALSLTATMFADPLPAVHSRGKVVLVVDRTMAANSVVGPKIDRLIADLTGDGWRVLRHDVDRGPTQADQNQTSQAQWAAQNAHQIREVRALIKADYDAAPSDVKVVFLLGHVAIPYSGDSKYIIGNHENDRGAHPADTFYGAMNSDYGKGGWTDLFVDNSPALTDSTRTSEGSVWQGGDGHREILNIPGDGKFDQDMMPSPMVLAVGRVDLYNMPTFIVDEATLISRYLDKDHDFRRGIFQVSRRAWVAIWDASAFDLGTYLPYTEIFDSANIFKQQAIAANWFPHVSANGQDYLLGYGAGYGGPADAYGVGYSSGYYDPQNPSYNNFVDFDSRVVFVDFNGSKFGDWNLADNFLRAPLANPYDPANNRHGYGLTAIWGWGGVDFNSSSAAKRALGGTIGESFFANFTGDAPLGLMGDPTLRLHTVLPASGLSSSLTSGNVELDWTASTDTGVSGYNIYRAPTTRGPFTLVNTGGAVTGSSYSTARPSTGSDPDNFYVVRAVKTETTPSGSYVNMSEGVVANAPGSTSIPYLNINREPANLIVATDTRDGTANAAAFTVDALAIDSSGNEQVTYQWLKNGTPLSDDGSHILGSNTRALLIKGVQAGDQANYSVVVSNGGNSMTSSSASLMVDPVQPLANDDIFNLPSAAPVDLDVLANDSDPDHAPNPLSITSVSGLSPLAGTCTINPGGGSIHFVPNANWSGATTFKYVITDGLKSDYAFVTVGLPQKVFPIKITGTSGDSVLVSATEDFLTWTSLGTVTLTANSTGFTDPAAGSYSHRFYCLKNLNTGVVNTVGFVSVTVPGKYADGTGGKAWIANQLNNPLGNTLAKLLPSVPIGTVISKYNAGLSTYSASTFSSGGWSTPTMTLNLGEGAIVQNPNATPLMLTFTGNVPTGSQTVNIPPGWSMVSSVFPRSADLDALGFPGAQDDQFLRLNTSSQLWEYNYVFDSGAWVDSNTGNPSVPVPAVGEAFFISGGSAGTLPWTENFSPVCSTTVKVTSPLEGALVAAPANISLSATASSDQGIAQVQFYHDGTLIGTGTGSGPYSFTWSSVAAGTYAVTAKATDNNGVVTVSLPVNITVVPQGDPILSTTSLSDSGFKFTISGNSGASVDVFATEDFTTWTDLGSVPLVGGHYTYLDAAAGSYGHRFYTVKGSSSCSANTVGFVKLTVPGKLADGTGGKAYIANQLNNSSGNTLTVLFPAMPLGTVVSKYDPAAPTSYDLAAFSSSGWSAPSMTLNPGEGGILQNPGTAPLALVFTGNVPRGLQNVTIPAGYSLISSVFPRSADLDTLGFPAGQDDDQFLRFNTVSQQLETDYVFGNGAWTDNLLGDAAVPVPEVGEGFFFYNALHSTLNWAQSVPSMCPPVVSVTSPIDGGIYVAPASISLSATASSDQGIAQVQFYHDGTLIGTGTGSGPYTLTWSGVAAGTYAVTAKATDNNGVVTVSLPVNVTVAPSGATVLSGSSLSSSGFQFTISGVSGAQVSVFATEDFATWSSLGLVTLAGGTYNYLDSAAGSHAHRFYSVANNSVYSVNTVGFVKVSVPGKNTDGTGGRAFIANQLNNPLGNTLAVLLPGLPSGTVVSKYVSGSGDYDAATFSSGVWSSTTMKLNPGEGAIIQNPGTSPLALTFTGNVPIGLHNVNLPHGYSLVSSVFPRSVDLDTLGFPGAQDDEFLRWDTVSQQWDLGYVFDSGAWADAMTGEPAVPVPAVGEGFFISKSSNPVTWSKSLSASP